VRINSLHIVDFGKFTGEKLISEIDDRIALFYGPNEAGKTTLFNLIKALFYGFYPATSEAHPYSSWKNGRIEFTGELTDKSGEKVVVYRKLLSTPNGKCMIGEKHLNLRNKTLPYAEHVSQEIYDRIYSLRVEDLVEIQGKAWEEVEDKLLANYGTDFIRSTRDVLKDIKRECDEIWRESNRGNFLIKGLLEEIKELKKLRKRVYEDEHEIRRLDERINNIKSEIDKLDLKRLEKKTLLNKAKELKPLKELLEEIKELEEKQNKEATSIPNNIRERLEELEYNLQGLLKEENAKKKFLQERKDEIYEFTREDNLILENKSKISSLAKEYRNLEGLKDNIHRIDQEISKINDRIIYESNNILVEDWNLSIREKFEGLKKAELQILVNKFRASKEKLKDMELKRNLVSNEKLEIKLSKAYIYSLVLGIALIIIGFFNNNNAIEYIGLGGLFYGVTGIINYQNLKRNYKNIDGKNESKVLEKQIEAIKQDFISNKKELLEYLKGIPISELTVDNMDDMFLPNILKIMDSLYNLKEKEKELLAYKENYSLKENMIKDFTSGFSFEGNIREEEKIFLLQERLEKLERNNLLNNEIQKDIVLIEKEINSIHDKIKELNNIIDKFVYRLKEIGKGDLDTGFNIVEENYRLQSRIEALREKLNSWSNLDTLIKEIEEYDYNELSFSDFEILKTEEDLEAITTKIKELEVEKARAEETINQLSNNITIDEIDSKLLYLEEQLMTAYKKRDRLAVLSEIIRFADQKFREDNQPDVLKSASKYFEIMTGGRYTDIFIEDTGDERYIMVKKSKDGMPQRVLDTFSKGTLNQLYLSLRLSLVDHLDRNGEPLPISFDELLVNWDKERLDSSLELLEEVSKRRQVFIFTCHDWMAEKVEKHFLIGRNEL